MLIAMLFASAALAAGSTEYVLHAFRRASQTVAGCSPVGNLVADSAGNLYGSGDCGEFGEGVVFKLTRPVPPAAAWTESVLYSFTGGADGGLPQGGLLFDAAGNLYGTTYNGGSGGWGTVFELSPPATGLTAWTETVLYSFQGGTIDGKFPQSGLVQDSSGNLYGVTLEGGVIDGGACPTGCGVVFELSPLTKSGGASTETVLHYFNGPLGNGPIGTLIFDARGDLYGATEGGGKSGNGLVFRLTPPAAGQTAWAFKVLYAFSGAPDGVSAFAGLTIHGKGDLYGTTTSGGETGHGTVFRLAPPAVAGGAWTETVLHSFAGGSDGDSPRANVVFDSEGNLYGTTVAGGGEGSFVCSGASAGCGTVFELSPPAAGGSTWTETILHPFPSSASDGYFLSGGVIFAKSGALVGGNQIGGTNNALGTVYAIYK
jgi:uncharacterized repeat protein (TIGR03803 family)